MQWLPPASDFKRDLLAARQRQGAPAQLEALAALAQTRLGFLEEIQLDNALRPLLAERAEGFLPARVAVLSSATVDQLLPGIRVAGLRHRLLVETIAGGFGQFRQELLDPASKLAPFRPDVVVLSLGAASLLGTVPLEAGAAEADAAVARAVDDLRQLWRQARERFGATVVQQTCLDVAPTLFGGLDAIVPAAPRRLVAQLNERIAAAAAADGALLLDVARASARDGLDAWFDVGRWLQGKMEIAPGAAGRFGELLARLLAAARGRARKCLVLDLDNTLWGGVVGDDGVEGLALGEGSARGEAHLALQRYALQLKQRGVILAVCSKNDPQIAATAFREHPEMALKPADIAAFVANWTDKAENLRAIAAQLNIGLDSLVFVDDNPAERERIRRALPMVAVPELPADPAHYVRCVADAGYFEATAFTAEDRQRAEQYAAESQREALRASVTSMDDYLRGLEMSVAAGPVRPVDAPRAVQLINKTNQFNLTSRRLSAEAFARFTAAPGHAVFQFRLIDRFSDNGVVSVLLLRPDAQPGSFEIENWVMSCRVFGRQLEDEILNYVVEQARALGAQRLGGGYVATAKSGVVRDLYQRLGFTAQAPRADETARWQLDLSGYSARPTHIRRVQGD